MIDLNETINDFSKLTILMHLEKDFVKKNKYDKRIDTIVNKVFKFNLQDDFFNKLFIHVNPWVKADAAISAFARHYKLHEALEVLYYLKNNANTLVFCDDNEINSNSRKFYANESLDVYKDQVDLYDSINNEYIFLKYYEYSNLVFQFYINYNENRIEKSIKYMEKINMLLDDLVRRDYVNEFFQITKRKFDFTTNYLILYTINAYLAYKYIDDKNYAINVLKKVKGGSPTLITPGLRNLATKYLNEIY